jgi:hypothetical protein
MKYLLPFLLALAALSCEPKIEVDKQCPYACHDPLIVPYFTGYQAGELDSVMLRTFDSSDHLFQNKLSEKLYRHPDTFNVVDRIGYDTTMMLSAAMNYQIFMPATGKVYNLNFHTIKASQMFVCGKSLICMNAVDVHMVDLVTTQLEGIYRNEVLGIKLKK